MKRIFADTAYWVAVVKSEDQWAEVARHARDSLGEVRIVTTDEVLSEFLTALSRAGYRLRHQAVRMVRAILSDPSVEVLPQSRDSFTDGLVLYERRLDKQYSLTDCIIMQTMRAEGVPDILTADRHFAQEGFSVLMERE
jgi:predicted nucleic acid-binding protein